MCGILFLLQAAMPRYGEARDAFEEAFERLKTMNAARGTRGCSFWGGTRC